MKWLRFLAVSIMLVMSLGLARPVAAQFIGSNQPITFESFNGIYHLSRDSHGSSRLNTEETIVADFPNRNPFYGITRGLPKASPQGNPITIKNISIHDGSGSVVPFKTSNNNNDLVITTGDPSIVLYGKQTLKISYQVSGLINHNQKSDQLLLDTIGRGWNQPFGSVAATLYMPDDIGAKIKGKPACYISLGSASSDNCQVSSHGKDSTTVIKSATKNLGAQQSLMVKLDFQPMTFKFPDDYHKVFLYIFAGFGVAIIVYFIFGSLRSQRRR